MRKDRRIRLFRLIALSVTGLALPELGWGTDINYVQPAAMDQPRINAYLSLAPDADPQSFDGMFNIQAFFDTGASGILLSSNTAGYLGVQPSRFINSTTGLEEDVIFHDVGVVGGDRFYVSQPLHWALAPFHELTDIDNISTYSTVYTQRFGPLRAQVGPIIEGEPSNPLFLDLDVFGVPLMKGKVVVMDPKPVNSLLALMNTYVYDPGTPYNDALADSNPGIPTTSRHIKLSYGDFERFTSTTPEGAPGPSLDANPFIGPNPISQIDPTVPPGDAPGVKVSYNGQTATGSWLLDTGAAASIMSKAQAELVGVAYDPDTEDTDSPTLLGVPLDDQFTLTIGGIGGTRKVAGFFLDSMLLRTEEGNAANDDDPNHIRFVRAPVLVSDIKVPDPITGGEIVLDGIFGMNYLVASAHITEVEGSFPIFNALSSGPFSWAVYDDVNGRLGLELDPGATEKQSLIWQPAFINTWVGLPFSLFTGPMFMDERGNAQHYKDGDIVRFDDSAEESVVDLLIDVAPDSVVVENSSMDYTFTSSTDARIVGSAGLIKRGTGMLTIQTPNTYRGPTEVAEGEVVFAVPQDIGAVFVRSGARVAMETSQRFAALHVADGVAVMQAGGDKLLVVDDLDVSGTGKLDVADNAVVVRAAADTREAMLEDIEKMLQGGRGAGANLWMGEGIGSSVAALDAMKGLAAVINDDGAGGTLRGSLMGESTGMNDILIVLTWNGDANVDGVVNALDYFAIDSGFLAQRPGVRAHWSDGDFNYDGVVNALDYFLIDSAFLGQTGPLAMGAVAAVPEPGWGVVVLGVAGVMATRRRKPEPQMHTEE